MTLVRVVAITFALVAGSLSMFAVAYFPPAFIAAALAAIAGAEFSVGSALGWKALDAFSVALREAQALPKDERRAFRASSRRRRGAIAAVMGLLAAATAIAGALALGLRDARLSDPALPMLLQACGAAVGVGAMLFAGLWRQYFGGDDLVADVRDRVSDHLERARQVQEMAAVDTIAEQTRQAIPLRRVIGSA